MRRSDSNAYAKKITKFISSYEAEAFDLKG